MAAAPATFNSCSDSLKRKGRFKVRRIRSGSAEADDDDDDDDQVKKEKEQSPGAGALRHKIPVWSPFSFFTQ